MKCVFGCNAVGARLHGFPHPNQQPKLIKKWLDIISNAQDINQELKTFLKSSNINTLHNSIKVCDNHFKREHKTHSGRIMYGAVPSINLRCIQSTTSSCHIDMDHNYSSERVTDNSQIPTDKPFRFIFLEDEDIINSETEKDNVIVGEESKLDTDNLLSTEKIAKKDSMNTPKCTNRKTPNQTDKPFRFIFHEDIINSETEKDSEKVCDESKLDTDNLLSTEKTVKQNSMNTAKCTDKKFISKPDIVKRKTYNKIVDKTKLFTWQRDGEIVHDESKLNTDNLSSTKKIVKCTTDKENIPDIDNTTPIDSDKDLHVGYKCDMCKGPIYRTRCRFRYACVQCVNYDVCGACERLAAHAHHYLLRVPRPKPYGEVQQLIDTMKQILSANIKSMQSRAKFIDTLLDKKRTEEVYNVESDPLSEVPDYSFTNDDDEGFEVDDEGFELPLVAPPIPSVSPPRVIPDHKAIEKSQRRKDREKDSNVTATPIKSIVHVAIDVDKHVPSNKPTKMDTSTELNDLKLEKLKEKINDSNATATPHTHTDEPIEIEEDIIWSDEELLGEHQITQNHLIQDKQNLESKNTNEKRHNNLIQDKQNLESTNTNEKRNNHLIQDKHNLESKNTNEKRDLPRILKKSNRSPTHNKVNKTLVLALTKKTCTPDLINQIKHSLKSKACVQVKRLSKEEIKLATKT